MMSPVHMQSRSVRLQKGLTLVELMVAVAINLVLVLAATLLYLNTRSTQKMVDEKSAVSETGQFALALLGRELTLAGFFPTENSDPAGGGLVNASGLGLKSYDGEAAQLIRNGQLFGAYAHGLMGCNGQMFSAETHTCEKHAEAAAAGSDSLAVAYFTHDAMGLSTGLRADCARADVANDNTVALNSLRVGATSGKGPAGLGVQPAAPLLVVNHYFLRPTTLTREGGGTVQSLALACRGNGSANGQDMVTTELVQGVEQLVLTYGVRDPEEGVKGTAPHRYITADDVSKLEPMSFGDQTLDGWQQVLAVRVCVVVRSTEATARGESIVDCEGNAMSLNDGGRLQRFERVFSLKNRQGVSTALSGG